MAKPYAPGLILARKALGTRQATYVPTRPLNADVTAACLDSFTQVTLFAPTDDPGVVRRGAYRYYKDLELERIARGKSIIRRVQPGPFEDPAYLAILAFEAASLELAWERLAPSAPPGLFPTYLLGTVHGPDVNAYSAHTTADGYRLVVINSGLVDFIYQSAKVIVAAASPERTANGPALVHASFGAQSAIEHIETDPEPADRLYRTLAAYFFDGYPRAFSNEIVPEAHHPVLSLLVGLAERWIIAHEYGHGIAPEITDPPPGVNVGIAEEYFSDAAATIATVYSAGWLDNVPPEFPLGSAIFALACIDVLDRAHQLISTGAETEHPAPSPSHPTPRDRARQVLSCFRQYFDVSYADNNFNLSYVLREECPEEHGFTEPKRVVAFSYANALEAIWSQVRPRLLDDYINKRPLHPIWDRH